MKSNELKYKKNNRKRKFFVVAFIAFLIIIATATVIVMRSFWDDIKENSTVATVNGESISMREIKHIMGKYRAEVFGYFSEKYGTKDSENFWTSIYGGEVPKELLKKKALEECIRIQVQFSLAKREEIIEDASYKAFLKSLEVENKRRKKAVENNQIVYGPVQYNEDNYLSYVLQNRASILKEKLKGKELKADSVELKQYFEENKDKYFKNGRSVRLQMIEIGFIDLNGNLDKNKKSEAEEKILEAKKRLNNDEEFDDLMKIYNENNQAKQVEFADGNKFSNADPVLMKAAYELEERSISDVVESLGAFRILRCTEKASEGYMTYDPNNNVIMQSYMDWSFKGLVDKMSKEAKVEVNSGIYDSIGM